MLHVDIPALSEIRALIGVRADACLSIYVSTTPQTQHVSGARIAFGNLLKEGLRQLEDSGFDKHRRARLEDECLALKDDDEFWRFQAHSLAVLATPDRVRTFRLATAVIDAVQVSDRFELKPLLRAIAFPQTAFVLALSENAVRLIKIFPDLPPGEIRIHGLPKSAADAVGRASVNNLTQNTRIANAEGQTFLLRQYARQVDTAVRGFLAGQDLPLILASTDPLASMYRNLNNYPGLLDDGITASPDRMSDGELANVARPVLDNYYKAEIQAAKHLYEVRSGERRATTNLSEVARAATNGAIDLLFVDIDSSMPGIVSETDGAISIAHTASAETYDILDEITQRALSTGAKFLGVRRSDIPDNAPIAAILRYPI